MYIVLSYIKISNSVGRNDNCRALAFLPTLLDIFDIRHHYARILILTLVKTFRYIDKFSACPRSNSRDSVANFGVKKDIF